MSTSSKLDQIIARLERIERRLAAGLAPGSLETECAKETEPQHMDPTDTDAAGGSSFTEEVSALLAALPPAKRRSSSKPRSQGRRRGAA